MKWLVNFALAVLLLVFVGCSPTSVAKESPVEKDHSEGVAEQANVRTRHFRFNYRFDVTGLEAGSRARIWLPVPQSSEFQEIKALAATLPGEAEFHVEPKYSNRILYVEATVPDSGTLKVDLPYAVQRHEVRALESSGKLGLAAGQRDLFLQANAKVPVDGRPLTLLDKVELSGDSFDAANQLYNLVDEHVTYDKEGTGWGNGDSVWVCESKRGNCTDFHSLFISLARSQGIPSRFEIGFPIPTEPSGKVGGYHCWAWSHVAERGWIPVDISEADKHPEMKEYYFGSLTPDRVTFSMGRDIELLPKPATKEPLNFFVYPFIEQNDKTVPRSQIALQFSYENMTK